MTTLLEDLFDISSPFDLLINLYNLTQELSGGFFTYFLVALPFISSWILTKKVVVPAIMFTIIGGPLLVVAPYEIKGVAMIMFIFGIGGLVYTWFKDR